MEWLNELKVGDQVCYQNFWHGYQFETITKITQTGQIKTDKGNTFKKGISNRGYSNSLHLVPITQIILDAVRRGKLYRELRDFKTGKFSLDQLERIAIILGEENK